MRLKLIFPLVLLLCANIIAQDLPLAKSLQAIVVTTTSWNAVQGTAQLFERKNTAKWQSVGNKFPVVIGKNGLAWSEDAANLLTDKPAIFKHEGDGKSPAGIFNLTSAFGSTAKPEFVKFPFTELIESTECVDDIKSAIRAISKGFPFGFLFVRKISSVA